MNRHELFQYLAQERSNALVKSAAVKAVLEFPPYCGVQKLQ